MDAAARAHLARGLPVETRIEVCAPGLSFGAGGAIVLRAQAAHTILGAAAVAERGVRAEQLGQVAAQGLARDLDAGATLDVHAADQMLVFLALASARSAFHACELTSHARTAMWLLERLAGTRFAVQESARGVHVRVEPAATRPVV
jgi:RNA 3'-terminal phosphate cyclase